MAHVALHAQERTQFGNGPTRRLRRQGLVPGVVYQPGGPSLAFALGGRELRKAIGDGGRSSVIDLTIGGGATRPVLLKDWQLDPVRGEVMHVDFVEVDLTQEVEAPVAVVLTSTPVGVREGGVLDQPLREVVVRALPDSLPDHLEFDAEALGIGDSVTVADLSAPEGVEIVTDPETVVASVVAPSAVAAEEPAEEEAAEGAEPAAPAESDEGEPSSD